MPLITRPRHSPVMNGAGDLAAPGSVLADGEGDQGRMTGCPPPQSQLSASCAGNHCSAASHQVVCPMPQPRSQRRSCQGGEVATLGQRCGGPGAGPAPGKEAGLPGAAGDQPQCDPPLLAVDTRAVAVGTHSTIAACTVSMCSCRDHTIHVRHGGFKPP